jgi:hypothetical protein
MEENKTSFRDHLTLLAESVELIEQTFLSKGEVEVKVKLEDAHYQELCMNLNNNINSNDFIIILGNINFTFSKK